MGDNFVTLSCNDRVWVPNDLFITKKNIDSRPHLKLLFNIAFE